MERKIGAPCVLYDRECMGCLECETCDLDENKVCDNCGKCIEMDDVASIKIDKIYTDPNEYHEKLNGKEAFKLPFRFYIVAFSGKQPPLEVVE